MVTHRTSRTETPSHEKHAGEITLSGIARTGGTNIVGAALGSVASLITVVILARSYGSQQAGLFLEAVAVATTASIVFSGGASVALIKFISADLASRRRDIKVLITVGILPAFVVGAIAALALILLAPNISNILASPMSQGELTSSIRYIAPTIPLAIMTSLAVAACRGAGSALPTVLFSVGGQPFTRLAAVFIVSAFGGGITACSIGWTLATFLCAMGALASLRTRLSSLASLKVRPGRYSRSIARDFWTFALPRCLDESLQVSNSWLLVIIVGALSGPSEATIYTAASRIAIASNLVLSGVIVAAGPRFSVLFSRGDMNRARHLYQTLTAWVIALSFPIAITLAIFPEGSLSIVSPDLLGGSSALIVLSLGTLINTSTGPVGAVLLMAGKSTWTLLDSAAGGVATFAIALVFASRYGALAAAVAWGSSLAINNLLAAIQIWRAFDMQPFTRAAAVFTSSALFSSMAVGFGVREIFSDTRISLLIGVAAVLAVHWLTVGTISRLRPNLLRVTYLAKVHSAVEGRAGVA